MRNRVRGWLLPSAFGLFAATGMALVEASAQEPTTRADAAAIVDGTVREIFRSPRQGRLDLLVQIDVQRSGLGKTPRNGARVICPAPGESIYVHLIQDANLPGRTPPEQSQVCAYLVPRARGGWEGTHPDWFDLTSDRSSLPGSVELPPAAVEPSPDRPSTSEPTIPVAHGGKTMVRGLGLTAEALDVKGRFALRVTGVERGGPAQRAGIEIGDVIAGANGAPLINFTQLDELCRRGGSITLSIVDVNSGNTVPVEVVTTAIAMNPKVNADAPRPDAPAPPSTTPTRSLGISTEAVSIGGRSALKVVRVNPESVGAKAGLEVGDVLVGANGAAITGPEQLAAALHKSGSTLTLLVRDVRSGKDTPVEVAFGGTKPPAAKIDEPAAPVGGGNPAPAPAPASGASAGRLGAVTELTFFDTELAVKVTEVEPGGPAVRAGIQPGTIILKADGKSMLHPNDLIEAARKAANSIKLTIADPRNDRKTDVDVDLRGR